MSIVDVAKLAGVSVATVSRYLNRSGYVSDDTRERIRQSMDQIGYAPSALRRGPKNESGKGVVSGNILFLCLGENSPLSLLKLPLFPQMIGHVMDTLSSQGFNCMLAHSEDGKRLPPNVSAFKVDGALIFGKVEKLQGRLRTVLKKLPAVWIFREHCDPENFFDHVLYDNHKVGALATQYFAEKGIKHAAYIAPFKNFEVSEERRKVFVETAAREGISVEVFESAHEIDKPQQAEFITDCLDYLHNRKPHIKGIFMPTDDILLQIYRTLKVRDLLNEYTLLGCNNDPMYMEYMDPRPATVDINVKNVIARGMEQLLFRMRNPLDKARSELFIAPSIVEG